MNADPADFTARLRSKAAERESAAMPMIRAAAAVAPIMDRLMTTPDWDRYLQYLQARVEVATRSKLAALTKLSDPSVYEPSEMTRLKTQIVIADSMIQAWEFAINLPRALKDGGEAALGLISDFEKKNASADQPQP